MPLLCDENTAAEIEYVKYMLKIFVPGVNLRISFSQSGDQNLCTQGHEASFGYQVPPLFEDT